MNRQHPIQQIERSSKELYKMEDLKVKRDQGQGSDARQKGRWVVARSLSGGGEQGSIR